MPRLITLARIVAAVHMPICYVAIAMFFASRVPSLALPVARSVGVAGGLFVISAVLSKFLFNGDCALRIFEYCLRGLGGEEINHNRLSSMSTPEAMLMNPDALYRRLLWRSGLFILATTAICIGGAVATAILI